MKRLNLTKKLILLTIIPMIGLSCSDDNDSNNDMNNTMSTYLYASNNSNGDITYYDVSDMNAVTLVNLLTTSSAADGIYYDADSDIAVQASRSNFNLEGYSNLSTKTSGSTIAVDFTSSTDMSSPRELAVNGNFYVVADNADVDGNPLTSDGKLFIYMKNGNSFILRNVIITDIKLWGITFDGDDLYAVADATNELAVYTNFLDNSSNTSISPTKKIAIEGIVRTHGLTYDAVSDVMVLTDIAAASNGQDDGGFHIIENFTSKFNNTANGGTLSLTQQIRVAGAATLLGNPVDVAYDNETETVYIAEAGNGGGRILAFNNIGSGGNLTPVLNNDLAAASSVFLAKY